MKTSPFTPAIPGRVEKEAQVQREMLNALTAERKVIINRIVGLQEEGKKGKA